MHSIAQVPGRPSLADTPPGSLCPSGLADTLPSLVEDPGGPSLCSSPGSPEMAYLLGFSSVPGPGLLPLGISPHSVVPSSAWLGVLLLCCRGGVGGSIVVVRTKARHTSVWSSLASQLCHLKMTWTLQSIVPSLGYWDNDHS